MVSAPRRVERFVLRLLTASDTLFNRLYGWRFNPLYQSGTIVVALYGVLLVTGLWLILFYRIGTPWESVARLTSNPWLGNWVRGLHRYASDLAVIATAVHALRMFAEGRSWGARALAWTSGAVLLLLLFVCGWTGYVLVWDTFALHLAREGARMIDALPVLSEPTGRAFTGEQPLPSVFFFLNLFAHIGVPLAMGMIFWLHVKRVARPVLLPPRRLMWTAIGALLAAAIVWPLPMAPKADPFALPAQVPADLFFAFWMPLTSAMAGGTALLAATGCGLALLVVPLVTARRGAAAPPKSWVDEDLCVECVQCVKDCPYEAIDMIARRDERPGRVAHVDPALCVSCGICAGSCPPMGIGPAGRTGRDQIGAVRDFLAAPDRRPGEIVVLGCEHGAAAFAAEIARAGGTPYPMSCAGNVHTSVVELLIRGGAGGVLILTCPPRDCWHREGPRWLRERVYHGREAELQERVDRARLRIASADAGERAEALAILREFANEIRGLAPPTPESVTAVDLECSPMLEPEPEA